MLPWKVRLPRGRQQPRLSSNDVLMLMIPYRCASPVGQKTILRQVEVALLWEKGFPSVELRNIGPGSGAPGLAVRCC